MNKHALKLQYRSHLIS